MLPCICCQFNIFSLFFLSMFFFVIGVVLFSFWPYASNVLRYSQLTLRKGSVTHHPWMENRMRCDIYMFNWTNSEYMSDTGVKPKFQQIGPYVFRGKYERNEVKWNNTGGTISYDQKKSWKFDKSTSKVSLNDKIVTFNPIAATLQNYFRANKKSMRSVAEKVLHETGSKPIVVKTVEQLLTEGYDDRLIEYLRDLSGGSFGFNRFGWFSPLKGRSRFDAQYTISTGLLNISTLGDIVQLDSKTRRNVFEGDCDRIQGSTGEIWSPISAINESKTIFIPEICRSVKFIYNNHVVDRGITGMEFVPDEIVLGSGKIYDENKCYCPGSNTDQCPPSGLLDVSKCWSGSPIFASFPHFYTADSQIGSALEGMHPKRTLHRSNIIIDPNSGVTLKRAIRIQINLRVEPDEFIELFRHVPKMIFPVFWYDESLQVDNKTVTALKVAIRKQNMGFYIGIGILVAAVVLAICMLTLILKIFL